MHAFELNGDLGGPIVRDKLWFYGATRLNRPTKRILGFSKAPGADLTYGTSDDEPGTRTATYQNHTLKGTYQVANNYKLIGFYTKNLQRVDPFDGSRQILYEAARLFLWNPTQYKAEIQGTISSRLLVNLMIGRSGYEANYYATEGFGENPSARDLTTLLYSGPAQSQRRGPRASWQPAGSLTYVPAPSFLGSHEFKSGFSFYNMWSTNGYADGVNGNYLLLFDTVAGVPHQPFQITVYNYPVVPKSRLDEGGIYAQDTWRVNERLTLNLGLRWDTFHAWVPEQERAAGEFAPAEQFPYIDVNTWRNFAPRLGVAFNLTSDGKTVFKSMYGRFNHTPGDEWANDYNRNAQTSVTYRWRDLNGNADYDRGEVNLSTNGPDFISLAGSANNTVNPDVKGPFTTQFTLGVERELAANFGVRLNYIYIRESNAIGDINVRRPFDVYNVQLPRQDPGPDGVLATGDEGPIVTLYDYDPAYRGSNFVENMRVNVPRDRDNRSHIYEVLFSRRHVGRWGLMTSGTVQKLNRQVQPVIRTPNDLYAGVDDTWDWQGKIVANYELPYRIHASAQGSVINGLKGQRTYIFRNIPSSARSIFLSSRSASPRAPHGTC